MSDPMVYQLGAIADIDGILLPVGVDYGTVSIGNVRLASGMCEEFARLFNLACWQAAAQLAQMVADEVHDGV
jgi:hypothetical protein